jgi:hypothetical protein
LIRLELECCGFEIPKARCRSQVLSYHITILLNVFIDVLFLLNWWFYRLTICVYHFCISWAVEWSRISTFLSKIVCWDCFTELWLFELSRTSILHIHLWLCKARALVILYLRLSGWLLIFCSTLGILILCLALILGNLFCWFKFL